MNIVPADQISAETAARILGIDNERWAALVESKEVTLYDTDAGPVFSRRQVETLLVKARRWGKKEFPEGWVRSYLNR